MKNNKGFTLIEIISALSILISLILIISIVISIYSSSSFRLKNLKERIIDIDEFILRVRQLSNNKIINIDEYESYIVITYDSSDEVTVLNDYLKINDDLFYIDSFIFIKEDKVFINLYFNNNSYEYYIGELL